MPLLVYTTNIPSANNNPSVDQGPMEVNTNSISSLIAEDHYGFNDNQGGLHKQTRLISLAGLPTTLTTGGSQVGTLYSRTGTESQIYFTPDQSTNQYQLTRASTGNFTTFGTNTNYSGTLSGGWTFLPGGLVLQYGIATSSSTSLPNTTVSLPFTMTNVAYSVNCTILTTVDSRFFVEVYDVSTNQFRAVTRDSSGSKTSGIQFYWQVIGK